MTLAEGVTTEIPRLRDHPLLGSLRPFRDDMMGLLLRVAREHPDIVRLRFGVVPAVIVGSPALAHEILQVKTSAFVKTPGLTVFLKPVLGNGLLTSEGAFHASQRKLLAPAFAHKRVAAYAVTMAERAARFADGIRDGETFDLSDRLMELTLSIVGKTLFDAEVGGDAETVGEAVTLAMRTTLEQLGSLVPIPPFVPTPQNLRTKRAVGRLDDVLFRIIRARRNGEDRGDLLSMLLDARDESGGGMTDRQVRDEAMTLFLAGHETTANALGWTFYLLAKHPDARARLEAEVDALGRVPSYEDLERLPYTLAVLKEALRLYPPAHILARRVEEPVTIGGHRIARHVIVLVNVFGMHRRADVFEDPYAFRPERFLGDAERRLPRCAYLPFGAGPRVCIGNHFALMEGHVLLATLARRLRFDPAGPAEVEMEPLVTLRPRGLNMRTTVRPATLVVPTPLC